jgi:3-oxoacyl-[acyl-carrier protein] reductase
MEVHVHRQVAIVTGGSRGIGRATAIALVRAGWDVVTCGRDKAGLAETEAESASGPGTCRVVVADLARPGQSASVVASTLADLGRVDLLVNNAGIAPLSPIESVSDETFDSCWRINVAAPFEATRAVWPAMKEQGGGVIVNISSLASIDPFTGFQIYGASKAWLNLFTRSTADEGRDLGIRVFALALGTVETRLLRDTFPTFPADQTLAPESVAETIVGLTQPEYRHLSGNTLICRK